MDQGIFSKRESIVEASISDLSHALTTGAVTSIELVTKYLLRVAAYDTRNTCLNSIPLINKQVFLEAEASDERRANGKIRSPLDGIPFTVKDSYKVHGMTVASGSLAFQHLVANEDAFTVKALRDAGAVLLGKTNMCPMAYGGMLRGVYGRAESPYSTEYLAAAFGSGSSNGSGVSVAASFAAFGMGEETVSSGRSPASNNALVAYTPSRGIISIRGNWPLYPTCDVVVPHTRTVDDLCMIMNAITAEDNITAGDFWRDQPFKRLSENWQGWPKGFLPGRDGQYLDGKSIAVPQNYIAQRSDGPYVSSAIPVLWSQARRDLEDAGAHVTIIDDLPLVKAYEQSSASTSTASESQPHLPDGWNAVERGKLIAYAWEDFLHQNKDPQTHSLESVNPADIFPHLPSDNPQVKFTEPTNAVHWSRLASHIQNRGTSSRGDKSSIFDIPQLEDVVHTLEAMRVRYLEEWMDKNKFDYIVFPAAGDIARANSDIDDESAKHAWTNGVKYSHGNRAFRHLGVPSVTVPMGIMQGSNMPMGLTFLGRAYDDVNIIKVASTYERRTARRVPPPLTPVLSTDIIETAKTRSGTQPTLTVTGCSTFPTKVSDEVMLVLEGNISYHRDQTSNQGFMPTLAIFVDGVQQAEQLTRLEENTEQNSDQFDTKFQYRGRAKRPPTFDVRNQVDGKIARDSIMIIVVAANGLGKSTGLVELIHNSEIP